MVVGPTCIQATIFENCQILFEHLKLHLVTNIDAIFGCICMKIGRRYKRNVTKDLRINTCSCITRYKKARKKRKYSVSAAVVVGAPRETIQSAFGGHSAEYLKNYVVSMQKVASISCGCGHSSYTFVWVSFAHHDQ